MILPFYDIEGKGVKLHRRGTKATMEQLQELDLSYELEKRKESLGAVACEILEKSDGGASKMNDRGKRMMVDTIIKLVDSSPSKNSVPIQDSQ